MLDLAALLLTVVAVVTVGLVGGVFFIFSVTIMRALGRIAPAGGIAAMQEINVVILQSQFITAFVGAAIASALLAGFALVSLAVPGRAWLIAGSIIYLVGSVLVTMRRNVPLNRQLASVEPSSVDSEEVWRRYLEEWTVWNHLRTVACIMAVTCYAMALIARG